MKIFKKLTLIAVTVLTSFSAVAASAPKVVVVKSQPTTREVVVVEEPVREVRYVERGDNFYPPRTWLGVAVDLICTPFVWFGEWIIGCDDHHDGHRNHKEHRR